MTIKLLGAFGAGAALGSLITYFVIKDKFTQETEEAVESVRQMYKKKYEGHLESQEGETKEKTEIPLGDAEFYKPETTTTDRIKYEKMVGKYWQKRETAEDEADSESPKEDVENKPYIITGEQFASTMPYYTKISCTYYAGDGQLIADETSDIPAIYSRYGEILDVEYNIGIDVLDAFDDIDDLEGGILYIRNDSLNIDFEIFYDEECYNKDREGESPGDE